jgi:hypothetical protein
MENLWKIYKNKHKIYMIIFNLKKIYMIKIILYNLLEMIFIFKMQHKHFKNGIS